MKRYTPEKISELAPDEIFVFGSNLAGRHGTGAALMAKKRFGAVNGIGTGLQGACYAIPTKDRRLNVLPLWSIRIHIVEFTEHAKLAPELTFLVTKIGCGLSGYSPADIAPMFRDASENVILPKEFQP